MLKELRRRLIITYTLSTCLLLSVIVAGSFLISVKQTKAQQTENFNIVFRTVADAVMNTDTISDVWLSRMEARNRILIRIYSNGIPLEVNGAWSPPDNREYLFQKLRDILDKEEFIQQDRTGNQKTESVIYSLYGNEKGHYYGRAAVSKQLNNSREVYILQYQGDGRLEEGLQAVWYVLLDLAGCAVLFLICRFFVDKTLKPLENGLRKQKEFIAAASHELRSPLTVIRAGLHAIQEEPAKAPLLIPGIDREGERMGRLIQDMLLLASSDAGTWTIREEILAPDTLLISISDTLMRLCRKKKQKFTVSLPEDEISPVCADRERLEQILMILVDNAASYSPEGSEIRVNLIEKKRSIYFEVVDHGRGISKEDKEQIFERFYRVDSSRREKQHFGLGLSIARELVKLHRGRITVADTPGGGSTFTVELPASAGEGSANK